jgi:hypothetical protein
MLYQEIQIEYITLLRDKTTCQSSLAALKDGYISIKTISNKKYAYLQRRVDGKLVSEYVGEENLLKIRGELDERARLAKRIGDIDGRLDKIEAAANILDGGLRRNLVTLRRCAEMESMPVSERSKSLAFGSAMTALEGIPVSAETEQNLSRWANGNYSFQESFLNTLRAYNLAEV